MAYNLNSPEFARAWRIVSESLLAHFQGAAYSATDGQPSTDIPVANPGAASHPAQVPADEPARPAAAAQREELAKLFAANPVPQPDGGYLFKNLVDEIQDKSVFTITKYSDGTATFTLCPLAGSRLTSFINGRDDLMPSSVGILEGTPTAGCSIVVTEPGTGKAQGKSIRVLTPLRATVSSSEPTE